ncbi:MAG TPA: hypothetical protein VLF62_02170, partial [Candidatus Saccharimonadales bacterium]|nr:hypothetical protein [Candidatus Saccharimonadales bacterium]
LRNYIRHHMLPRLSADQRAVLLGHIKTSEQLHTAIEQIAAPWIEQAELPRAPFTQLPHKVAAEVLAAWLRHRQVPFDRPTIERLVVFCKAAAPHKFADIQDGWRLRSMPASIALVGPAAKASAITV